MNQPKDTSRAETNRRFPRAGRPASVLPPVVAIVALLSFLHIYRPDWPGLWQQTLLNVLHAPAFGVVALGLLALSARLDNPTPRRRLSFVLGASLLIGLASEAAQIPTSRDASLLDLLTNCLGALAFTLLALACGRFVTIAPRRRRLAGFAGAFVLLLAMSPLLLVSAAIVERNGQRPVLFDPGALFAECFLVRQHATAERRLFGGGGPSAYRVTLEDGRWPGLVFHDIWPDWSGYDALVISIASDDSRPLSLNVRIHDRRHLRGAQPRNDRFRMSFEAREGLQTLRIPLAAVRQAPATRLMDLRQIEGMAIFGSAEDAGRHFYLVELRLE